VVSAGGLLQPDDGARSIAAQILAEPLDGRLNDASQGDDSAEALRRPVLGQGLPALWAGGR